MASSLLLLASSSSSCCCCCTATTTLSAVASSSSSSSPPPPSKCGIPVSPRLPFSNPNAPALPRRLALGLALSLSPWAFPAFAKDIPFFGIRKRVEKIEEAVVEEVQQLVKEGQGATQLLQAEEKELGAVAGAVQSFAASASSSASDKFKGLSPPIQAGAVVGAELVAVLIASSVVNGLTRKP